MFTGIGAVFGIVGSAVNRGISIFEAKQQAKIDEKKRSDQFEMAKLNAGKDSVVASYDHDKSLGQNVSTWVANIRALVRPAITAYAFVFMTLIYVSIEAEGKMLILGSIAELLNTVVTWWFADRFKR